MCFPSWEIMFAVTVHSFGLWASYKCGVSESCQERKGSGWGTEEHCIRIGWGTVTPIYSFFCLQLLEKGRPKNNAWDSSCGCIWHFAGIPTTFVWQWVLELSPPTWITCCFLNCTTQAHCWPSKWSDFGLSATVHPAVLLSPAAQYSLHFLNPVILRT